MNKVRTGRRSCTAAVAKLLHFIVCQDWAWSSSVLTGSTLLVEVTHCRLHPRLETDDGSRVAIELQKFPLENLLENTLESNILYRYMHELLNCSTKSPLHLKLSSHYNS